MSVKNAHFRLRQRISHLCILIVVIIFLITFFSNKNIIISFLAVVIISILVNLYYIYEELQLEKDIRRIERYATSHDLAISASIRDPAFKYLIALFNENPNKLNESKYKNEIIERKIELEALQRQINPHFLYNTLDSIRGEALICGAEEVAKMTEALALIFRYCISVKSSLVTINDEIKNIKNYLLIQKFRFEDRFSYEILINASDDALNYSIPKLSIQPLVENALFHGLEGKRCDGKLTIRITETNRCMVISIEDNGCGMKEERLKQINEKLFQTGIQGNDNSTGGNGIALVNVNDRIKLAFGEEYGIVLYSAESVGTNVEITIPKERAISNDLKTY